MHSNLVWNPPFELNFGYPKKKPTFTTIIHSPVSKRGEIRASLQPYPEWEIEYLLDHARGGEQDQDTVYQFLLGFCLNMGAQFSDFLFRDQTDNHVEQAFVAIADGDTMNFQLIRQIGIGEDIVQIPVVDPPPLVYVNGSATTAFTMGALGILQFSAAPAANAVISWTGDYFLRVRFDDDGLEFQAFMEKIWECGSIKLRSVLL